MRDTTDDLLMECAEIALQVDTELEDYDPVLVEVDRLSVRRTIAERIFAEIRRQ